MFSCLLIQCRKYKFGPSLNLFVAIFPLNIFILIVFCLLLNFVNFKIFLFFKHALFS